MSLLVSSVGSSYSDSTVQNILHLVGFPDGGLAEGIHNHLHLAGGPKKGHVKPYELSQDLIAKNLEVLEKKYGGSKKAKEAALTIQRAFRR